MAFTPALDVAETGNTKFTSGKPVMAPATNAAVTIAAKLFHMTIPLLQPLSFLFRGGYTRESSNRFQGLPSPPR